MTEDSAIRIDLTLQSLYTLPTHGASPTPKTPGTRPTGSLELAPASSELDIPKRPIYRVSPYRITDMLTQVMSWVAPVSSRHYHRMAPTIAWHKTCPKRGRAQNILAVKTTAAT